jgi:hypothetical protein
MSKCYTSTFLFLEWSGEGMRLHADHLDFTNSVVLTADHSQM